MICTQCRAANAPSALFCINCGANLAVTLDPATSTRYSEATAVPQRSRGLIIGLAAAVIALLCVVGVLVYARQNNANIPSTTASTIIVPPGARPLSASSNAIMGSPSRFGMDQLTCDALRTAVMVDACAAATSSRGTFAVTLEKRQSQQDPIEFAYLAVYRHIVAADGTPYTELVHDQSTPNFDAASGISISFDLYSMSISGEAVIAILEEHNPKQHTMKLQLWALDLTGMPRNFGQVEQSPLTLYTMDDHIVVERSIVTPDDPFCCPSRTEHRHIYPTTDDDTWYEEVLEYDNTTGNPLLSSAVRQSPIGGVSLTAVEPPTVEDSDGIDLQPGLAPVDLWVEGVQMSQPACDGSYITIVLGAGEGGIIGGLANFPGGQYLRTDITCASLNPTFSSGALKGQPIFVVFFGPYGDRYQAQQQCLDLGLTTKARCYIAPLTDSETDRNVRFGPRSP
jgi:hypothetical protein